MTGLFEQRRDLVRFLAVVEAGTISGASRKLNLTQPGITRDIARLEEAAGMELFERRSKGVKLNPFGEIVAEEARQLLRQVEAAEARVLRTRIAIEQQRRSRDMEDGS